MKRRPRTFISYRRDDSGYVASTIRDELERKIGKGSVFFDVDSIRPGQDFVDRIEASLAQSDVVLAIIGDNWSRSGDGSRCLLDDPADFVRQELELAFQHELPVIPVLTGKASMPVDGELPSGLEPLLRCQALELRAGKYVKSHLQHLVDAVRAAPLINRAESQSSTSLLTRRRVFVVLIVVAVLFIAAYPVAIHDRLQINTAVQVTRTVNLRPAPGTNTMPGTVIVQSGQLATYVDRSLRKYLLIREGGTYFDYWRKVRTANGNDGWIYGRYLESAELNPD